MFDVEVAALEVREHRRAVVIGRGDQRVDIGVVVLERVLVWLTSQPWISSAMTITTTTITAAAISRRVWTSC